MKKLLLILLGLTVLVSAFSQSIVAFDEENAPFMYGGNLTAAGVYPAIIKEAFARMKEPLTMQAVPWKRALAGIDSGENAVAGIYMNSDRLKKYDYSNAFFEERMAFFVVKGLSLNYKSVSDLAGRTIGVHKGWSYGDDFDKAVAAGTIKIEEADSDESNIKKLAAGRMDILICNEESGDGLIRKLGLSGAIIKLPTYFSTMKLYLAFNKKNNKLELLKKFNATIDAMTKDGTIKALAEKEFDRYNVR